MTQRRRIRTPLTIQVQTDYRVPMVRVRIRIWRQLKSFMCRWWYPPFWICRRNMSMFWWMRNLTVRSFRKTLLSRRKRKCPAGVWFLRKIPATEQVRLPSLRQKLQNRRRLTSPLNTNAKRQTRWDSSSAMHMEGWYGRFVWHRKKVNCGDQLWEWQWMMQKLPQVLRTWNQNGKQ